MEQHGYLPPQAETVLDGLQERILALELADASGVPGVSVVSGLGFIRHATAYSLHNLDLSHACLTLVLRGVKQVHACGNRPELAVPRGGLVYFAAGQRVSITNEPAADAAGNKGYLAFSLFFAPEAFEALARRVPPTPEAASPAPGLVLCALTAYLDLCRAGADLTLRLMQQEQMLWLLRASGLALVAGDRELAHTIRRLVEANPRHAWSSAEMARAVSMSERNLRRHLAGQGYSCSELIRLGRLHVGLGFLQQGRLSVEETAYACGYDSRSRFSQRFQEHFGLSPTALLLSRERKST